MTISTRALCAAILAGALAIPHVADAQTLNFRVKLFGDLASANPPSGGNDSPNPPDQGTNAPLSVATAAAPAATTGAAFSQPLTITGGTAPYTATATGLPAGIAPTSDLSAIAGTASTPGTYPFSITVTDSLGATETTSGTMTVASAAGTLTAELVTANGFGAVGSPRIFYTVKFKDAEGIGSASVSNAPGLTAQPSLTNPRPKPGGGYLYDVFVEVVGTPPAARPLTDFSIDFVDGAGKSGTYTGTYNVAPQIDMGATTIYYAIGSSFRWTVPATGGQGANYVNGYLTAANRPAAGSGFQQASVGEGGPYAYDATAGGTTPYFTGSRATANMAPVSWTLLLQDSKFNQRSFPVTFSMVSKIFWNNVPFSVSRSVDYDVKMDMVGGHAPYGFSATVSSGAMPSGMSIVNRADGPYLVGRPTGSGSRTFNVDVKNGPNTQTITAVWSING